MSDHPSYQIDLPAYAANRLDEDERARLETHLGTCAACRDLASDFQALGAAIRNGGESLFGPHPTEADLRRLAASRGAAADPGLRRHLAVCSICSLELEGWKR